MVGQRISYNSYYIAAADRREFERRFGRFADFKPKEIAKITYGRHSIYEAPPTQAEAIAEELGQGAAQSGMEVIQ